MSNTTSGTISRLALSIACLFFTVGTTSGVEIPMNTNESNVKIPASEEIDFEKEIVQIEGFEKKYESLLKTFRSKQTDSDLDNLISLLKKQHDIMTCLSFHFPRVMKSKIQADARQPVASNWLLLFKSMDDLVVQGFDFNKLAFANIAPIPDDMPADRIPTNELFISGMAPENIKNPEIRKDYEERLAKNAKYALTYRLQQKLKQLISLSLNEINDFIIKSYSQSPRADGELVAIIEKYEYPEEEKIKVFKALNIPYNGFREWKTNDGLFTLTAKVVSANKKDVTLEKSDGKQTTIELSALRKADQDYIKEQLAPTTP